MSKARAAAGLDPAWRVSSPEQFRQVFRRSANAVWVLTVWHAGRSSGMSASSVVSLCPDDGELMVSVRPGSSCFPLLQACGRFGLHLLHSGQSAIAQDFAGVGGVRGGERFRNIGWRLSDEGYHLLDSVVLSLACQVQEILLRRSHALVIGRIQGQTAAVEAMPLLHHQAAYWSLQAL